MKPLINLIVAFILVLITPSLFSQESNSSKNFKNSLHVEATAIVPSYGLVYNFIQNTNFKPKPYFGIGVQYFPHSVSHENVFTLYPHIGFMYGKSHNVEANIGVSLDIANRDLHLPIFVGYRYLAPGNILNIKACLTFIYLGKSEEDSFIDLPMFFPLPTIGIGVAL